MDRLLRRSDRFVAPTRQTVGETVGEMAGGVGYTAPTGTRTGRMATVTVLVTGAAGFIGMHTATRLLERGDAVVGIDNLNDYYDVALKEARLARLQKYDNFRFVRGDIADPAALAEAGRVWITVDDSGPGIPLEKRATIFRAFYTEDGTGTGLGLAIARELSSAMGGSVAVGDSPHGGARFVVELPCIRARSESVSATTR